MNPFEMMKMLQGSANPMQMLTQISRQNPMLGQVMQMVNGKTPAEMQQMAQSIAQQRGVDLRQMAQQMGIRLPM